ncbi:MAG: hypothetical protein JJ896_03625 [Rhodothermales bacterium]|nr:hypothetical protein [Rhodothermales bacterium]MBO6778724.1 hypothetical protein [Rhodothermales bacterium]
MQRLFPPTLALLLLAGCQSKQIDNSMIVDPGPSVGFAADVQPIFNRGCGGFGCHVGETTNGINLSTYADVMASVGFQYSGPTVVAGDADASPLVDKISPNPSQGSRMPLGAAPLSASDIALIRQWIDDGAEDN